MKTHTYPTTVCFYLYIRTIDDQFSVFRESPLINAAHGYYTRVSQNTREGCYFHILSALPRDSRSIQALVFIAQEQRCIKYWRPSLEQKSKYYIKNGLEQKLKCSLNTILSGSTKVFKNVLYLSIANSLFLKCTTQVLKVEVL